MAMVVSGTSVIRIPGPNQYHVYACVQCNRSIIWSYQMWNRNMEVNVFWSKLTNWLLDPKFLFDCNE